MRTYDEVLEQRAEFERNVMDTRANEVPAACPMTRESCAGRSCACAMRVPVGWICGLTSNRKGARARVVDVDADELLKIDRLAALSYIRRGCLYA